MTERTDPTDSQIASHVRKTCARENHAWKALYDATGDDPVAIECHLCSRIIRFGPQPRVVVVSEYRGEGVHGDGERWGQ